MKKMLLAGLVVITALFPAGGRVSVLKNGGFEAGGETPESWMTESSGVGCVFSRDPSVKRSGAASGKMMTELTNKRSWPAFEQVVESVVPGQRYEAEAWVRGRMGMNPTSVYMAFEFLDAAGKRVSVASSAMPTGDFEWTRLFVKATIPERAASLKLRLILYGAGTVWLDDVVLERNDGYQAEPKLAAASVRLRPTGVVVKESFGGFGAEIDPWLWNAENRSKGVGEEDAQLIASRVVQMRLPLARIFIQWAIFNPSGDRVTLDFESDGMQSLMKTLALCQTNGIDVILCGVEWGKRPYDDPPAAARAWGELLSHLVKQHGFTRIKWWEAWNEPNHTWRKFGYDFDRYIQIHDLMRAEWKARGLDLAMLGSDDSGDLPWFTETAKRMPDRVEGYATHHYSKYDNLEEAAERTRDRQAVMKAYDPQWAKKKLFVAEFGIHGPATTDRANLYMRTFDCGLGIAAVCLEQAALGIDGASLWCLHRIHYPGFNFMDYGLWEYKNENWKPRPVWYAYSLFSRFMARGSRLSQVEVKDGEGMVTSILAQGPEGRFLFVVNLSYGEVGLVAETGMAKGLSTRYLYDEAISRAPADRPLYVAGPATAFKGELKDKLPKRSLAVYQLAP
ncbi:MAG: hypothetical protein J0L75_09820 [Spirochaetes bacterium]|nr:hypothetical protein [Spirochaetota bacterium]